MNTPPRIAPAEPHKRAVNGSPSSATAVSTKVRAAVAT